MPKKISIVTPSYNHGQYLGKAIESVLSQAGDFYVEYTVADGASTDNSKEVIEKYDRLLKENKFPVKCLGIDFKWWSKKDNGQTQAMNAGLTNSTGDILADLDSDDFYEPEAFASVIKAFSDNPEVDLVYGDGRIIFEDLKKEKITKANPETFNHLLRRGNTIFQPSAFWTRRIADKIGFFDETLQYIMDYEYWLRILRESKALYLPKILATERLWSGTKTISEAPKFFVERKIIFKKYGGNFIDPKTIYSFRSKIPFSSFLRKKFPNFYKKIKDSFYFFIDRLNYNKTKRNAGQ